MALHVTEKDVVCIRANEDIKEYWCSSRQLRQVEQRRKGCEVLDWVQTARIESIFLIEIRTYSLNAKCVYLDEPLYL